MSITHVWSQYPLKDADTRRRHALAQSTWDAQPWFNVPFRDDQAPRLFREPGRQFPYLRDIFDRGCRGLKHDDIVVYTNADIGVTTDACAKIAAALQTNRAGYAFRRDLHKQVVAVPADADLQHWHNYAGTDLFFFRVSWWRTYREVMPDMIPAREAWDACLRVLMEDTNQLKPLAVRDICWHERHGAASGYWEDPVNRYTLPGQRHNLQLAKKFLISRGRNPAHFGIR